MPSVGSSRSGPGLHEEVFNILPGTVNSQRGVAQYESQDQAFLFHKQVWFEDNNSSPELRPDVSSREVDLLNLFQLMHLGYQVFQLYLMCLNLLLHHII